MRAAVMTLLIVSSIFFCGLTPDVTDQTPYRKVPELDLRIFACENPDYRIFSTRKEALDEIDRLKKTSWERSPCATLKDAFTESLDKSSIRWEKESLLIVADYYGTGMATAALQLSMAGSDAVDATIIWKVPPPPLTPDTAVCRFAFVVNREKIKKVIFSGRDPKKIEVAVR